MNGDQHSLLDLLNDKNDNNEDEAPNIFQQSLYYNNEGISDFFY